jgi:hypothetical protein
MTVPRWPAIFALGLCLGLAASALEPSERGLAGITLLASQPEELRERLLEEKLVILQEAPESGALSGSIVMGLVIFEASLENTYRSLTQTHRQTEFRSELTSVETISRTESGPVDEHRIKILFRRFAYRLQYSLEPSTHRIRWELAPDFESDLDRVSGFWELYRMDERRTLGRFGTSIDVGPMVPAFLQDAITREKVPDTMERTRHWVNAEHRAK